MYILRPDLGDEQVEQAISKYQNLIREQGAQEIQIQHRGKRRLSYEINKQRDGIYRFLGSRKSAVAPLGDAIEWQVIRYRQDRKSEETSESSEPEGKGLMQSSSQPLFSQIWGGLQGELFVLQDSFYSTFK